MCAYMLASVRVRVRSRGCTRACNLGHAPLWATPNAAAKRDTYRPPHTIVYTHPPHTTCVCARAVTCAWAVPLTDVRAAAEVSLNFVAPHPVCQAAQYAVMDVDLDFITAEKSTATSPASRATSPSQSQGSPSPGGLNAGAGAPST